MRTNTLCVFPKFNLELPEGEAVRAVEAAAAAAVAAAPAARAAAAAAAAVAKRWGWLQLPRRQQHDGLASQPHVGPVCVHARVCVRVRVCVCVVLGLDCCSSTPGLLFF